MISRLSYWLLEYRRIVVVFVHCLIWATAYGGAFLLRFDFDIPTYFLQWQYWAWIGPLLVLRGASFSWFGLFHG